MQAGHVPPEESKSANKEARAEPPARQELSGRAVVQVGSHI